MTPWQSDLLALVLWLVLFFGVVPGLIEGRRREPHTDPPEWRDPSAVDAALRLK